MARCAAKARCIVRRIDGFLCSIYVFIKVLVAQYKLKIKEKFDMKSTIGNFLVIALVVTCSILPISCSMYSRQIVFDEATFNERECHIYKSICVARRGRPK